MKSVKNLLLVALCVLTFGAINVDAYTIKESVDPADKLTVIEEGSTIVGITRFTPDQVLTAGRVNVASANYTHYQVENRYDECYAMIDDDGISSYEEYLEFEACRNEADENMTPATIYYYLMETWFEIDLEGKATPIEDEKTIEKLNSQYIFYVNNVAKMMNFKYTEPEVGENYTVKYTHIPSEGYKSYSSLFKYENGVLSVPAIAEYFYVEVYDENGEWVEDLEAYQVNIDHMVLVKSWSLEGSITDTPEIAGTVQGETITFEGEIPWYDSSELGRKAGNRVGVSIIAGSYFEAPYELADVDVIVDGFGYDAETMKWSVDQHGSLMTFDWYPLVTKAGEEGTIEVKWANSYSQVFTIKIAEDATLEAAPAGTIAWDEQTGNIVDTQFYVNEDGNTITFGGEGSTVAWYRENEVAAGLAEGNRVGIVLTAPEYYVENDMLAGATLVITDTQYPNGSDPIAWGTEETYTYYPQFTEAPKTITVKAIWEDGNEQLFTINLAEGTTLESPRRLGTITGLDTNPATAEIEVTDVYSSVVINGEIPFYSGDTNAYDGKRDAGHRIGIAITPDQYYIDRDADTEDEYELDDVKVVINASDKDAEQYSWSADGSDYTFNYWPLMSASHTEATTITVTWDEGVEQTFTIDATNATYENVYGEMKINTDDNGDAPTHEVTGDNAVITGEIKYYAADAAAGRTEGAFRYGVQIVPSEYYADKLADVKVYITDGTRSGKTAIDWADGAYTADDITFNYWPVVDKNDPETSEVRVVWEEGVEQVFTIDPSAATFNVLGTLEQQVADTTEATVEGNVMTITGEIPYYGADDSAFDGKRTAGHRVGLKIVPNQYYIDRDADTEDEYDLSMVQVLVEASDKTALSEQAYSWGEDASGKPTEFNYWPLMSESYTGKTQVTVTWEEGVTQTFEVVLGEGASYETLLGTIALNSDDEGRIAKDTDENENTVTIGEGTVYYYSAEGNRTPEGYRVGFQITPAEYYLNNKTERDAAKVYIWDPAKGEDTASEHNWIAGDYNGDTSTFNYWPVVEKDEDFNRNIKVVWADGTAQVFTVSLDSANVEYESLDGTMAKNADDTTESAIPANAEDTLVVHGAVTYYEKDAAMTRLAGAFRTGVQITASDYYKKNHSNLDGVKVTIKDLNSTHEHTWKDGAFGANGGEDTFYYWPALTPGQTGTIEIKVDWTATHSQTFNIVVEDTATYDLSGKVEAKNVASLTADVTDTENGQTIAFEGEIPYYGTATDRTKGHRVGVTITPSQYYLDLAAEGKYNLDAVNIELHSSDKVNIIDRVKTWADDKEGSTSTLDFWPLIDPDYTGETKVVVYWTTEHVETFTIDTSAANLANVEGTMTYIAGLSIAPEVNGNVANIAENSEVTYYVGDASISKADGNRFGFKIAAPTNLAYADYENADIIRTNIYADGTENVKTMTFKGVQDADAYYETWPLVETGLTQVKIEIDWTNDDNDYDNQTFIINVPESITLQAAPATN